MKTDQHSNADADHDRPVNADDDPPDLPRAAEYGGEAARTGAEREQHDPHHEQSLQAREHDRDRSGGDAGGEGARIDEDI